jgi:hypothetical protein
MSKRDNPQKCPFTLSCFRLTVSISECPRANK